MEKNNGDYGQEKKRNKLLYCRHITRYTTDVLTSDIHYIIGLSFFEGIGPARYKLLTDYFGSAREVFGASEKELLSVGLSEKLVQKFLLFRKNVKLDEVYKSINKKGIRVITEKDALYPKELLEIEGRPFILYLLGKTELLTEAKKVAIVGTRKPTTYGYGREMTSVFARTLAESGLTIVSGMAMGVDAIAHHEALEKNGKTIAVLGCGVDICYPPVNYPLYQRLKEEGLIISEFPPGMRTSKGVFPSRNRIVAGLATAVIITEGAEKSGSLITASFGAEYGRDVYAIPGPVTSPLSYATNSLLKNGAKIALDPTDVLTDMNISPIKKVPTNVVLSDDERKILDLFAESHSLHIDEISRNLNTDVSRLSVQLSILTMKGVLQEMDGGEYTIKT